MYVRITQSSVHQSHVQPSITTSLIAHLFVTRCLPHNIQSWYWSPLSLVNALLSTTVKVSGSDYWSDRMAEYTGKPNRVVFDETLERVYKQLYDNSANIY